MFVRFTLTAVMQNDGDWL